MNKNERLTEAEFKQMIQLLHRYVNVEMDQWELWKLSTDYDDVFISMSYYHQGSEQAYTDLSKLVE